MLDQDSGGTQDSFSYEAVEQDLMQEVNITGTSRTCHIFCGVTLEQYLFIAVELTYLDSSPYSTREGGIQASENGDNLGTSGFRCGYIKS